jgi:hypothetical protein
VSTRGAIAVAVAIVGCGGRAAPPTGPLADCKLVAETMASYELGNYAPPEQRAPIVQAAREACTRARVTVDEAACIVAAADGFSAKSCVRRMFPELASSADRGECQKVVDKIRAGMPAIDGRLQGWADEEFAIEVRACIEDAWPDALKTCLLGNAPTACTFPPALQAKLQQRITEAFQRRFKPPQN